MMTNFEDFLKSVETATVVPVMESLPADLLTPLSVYLKLRESSPTSFLLESVEGGETLARYSFIGVDPWMSVTGSDTETQVKSENGVLKLKEPLWTYLRTHFEGQSVSGDEDLPSFIGGAIGYLGFGCSGWFESSLLGSMSDEPQAELMFFRSIVAFDHAKQTVKIISLVFEHEAGETPVTELYDAAVRRNAEIKRTLESSLATVPVATSSEKGEVRSNWSRDDFENAVLEIKEMIRAGECYQVVLSQRFRRQTGATPVSIYRAIRSLNPSPYMFLLQFGDRAVIGASPEMLVRARGRQLEYRPIAGTRPRGTDRIADERLAAEMLNDAKEVAEHQMLVDLGRNDLGRVAEFGSVAVKELMKVEKYSHVQHLVSSLTAELRTGCDRFDALAACFPAGTVSGAPKVRAIEVIGELEPNDRGVYAGAVGYFDYAGNMDTCIAIRTLVLEDGVATVQAGCGIVADSEPALEYEESVNKAKAMLRAIELAEGAGL